MRKIRSKKNRLKTMAVMALAAMALLSSAYFYLQAVTESLQEETMQYLSELSRQGANTVERQMQGDLQTLRTVASFLGKREEFDPKTDMQFITEEVKWTNFKRMGLILPNGKAYRSDGADMLELGGRSYFESAMSGRPTISDALIDVVDGKLVYVYATPVYHKGTITSVLYATTDAAVYAATLDVRLLGGRGYSYITDQAGEVLIYPNHPESMRNIENIFTGFDQDTGLQTQSLEQMRRDMESNRDGVLEYYRDGKRRYMSYMNIRVNNWYMVSAVSADVVAARLTYLSGLTVFACLVVLLVVLGLCWYILHAHNRNRQQLIQLAYTDPVTGGRNWNGFSIDAADVLAESGDRPYAMVSFDIDKFKVFNDLFGHEQGNRMMCGIWQLLHAQMGEDEPFARTSADNFNLLIHYDSREVVTRRLEGLIEQVRKTNENFAVKYSLKLSFGVYPIEEKQLAVNLMSDRASIARTSIKGIHDRWIAFYDHTVRDRIVAEKRIENEMVGALESGQFIVYLQPKYCLATRTLEGAEALVRWDHPERGLISPGEFIPLFERNGFIVELDEYILDRISATLAEWIAIGIKPVPIAVNISRLHLHDLSFTERVAEIVARHNLPYHYIQLELTESILLDFENFENTAQMMNRLKQYGFTFAMDDFGTGYSSLNILRSLPVDVVKLDREFFGDSSGSERGRTVVADVIALAKHLNMTVVAEGVEEASQVAFLEQVGCDIVQGYFFARPMPVATFEQKYWFHP